MMANFQRLNHFLARNFSTFGKDIFYIVEIETQTSCNRKCKHCPNSIYDRGDIVNNKQMEMETFKKIISDLKNINFRGKISLSFFNEPLLDERLESFISYVKQELNSKVIIHTNGDYLTLQRYKELIEVGIDEIVISVYDKLSHNVRRVLEYREKFKKDCEIKLVEFFKGKELMNRGGLVNVENNFKRNRCNISSIVINYEGNVVLCCNDYFSSINFGNVKNQTLKDLWDSEKFKEIREELKNGNFNMEICKRCRNES